MPPEQLRSIFLEDVPHEFLSDLIARLRWIYPQTHRRVYSDFPPPEAHDALGVYRRAMIESSLRELASKYPQIDANVYRNHRKTQNYTELRAGRVVFTESCLHFPQSPVRHADFRAMKSRTLQHSFECIQPDTAIDDGAVFAILGHGPKPGKMFLRDWSNLGFAFVGFPTIDCEAWEFRIELMEAFGRPVVEQTERIQDRVTSTIRARRSAKKSVSGE